ncbi:MAG: hypothetical protein H6576_00300 [Lewinellaceae bacterium]|nr:hypothetical protein [Lewinellaceae bacterium]
MPWLSYHLYPIESQDLFLTRALKPFLDRYIWTDNASRAFFIRYQDEKGPHIRIRLKAGNEEAENQLKLEFASWFEGRGEWKEVLYQSEAERFGGEAGLALAEEHFDLSSKVVLARMAKSDFMYGDAMYDALRLHIISLHAAGFNPERIRWYFSKLYDQWLSLFFPVEEGENITSNFKKLLKPQELNIRRNLHAVWEALEDGKLDEQQPEWAQWIKGNKLILNALGENLEKALPSLIHLTNNRIGINNQDEVYLNYIFSNAV